MPAFEKERVRVFAVNSGAPVADLRQTFLSRLENESSQLAPDMIAELLGTHIIDAAYVEVFPTKDVSDLGLSQYLTQALEVREDVLRDDRARLDALEGSVMIVLSAAFGGKAATLSPGAALTLIGTYPTEQAVSPSSMPLPDPGGTAMPGVQKNVTAPSRRLGSGLVALIVGGALFAAAAVLLALSGDPQ
ncbi:MAG: hypothetical protein AAGF50_11335 [Pseudomonadota bacterium]